MIDNFRHIHFIGIGGSGISALAWLALSHGIKVSGSDMGENPTIKKLRAEGAEIFVGHRAENLNEMAELVIYTEAIDRGNNPEFLAAEKAGVRRLSYFQALGEMSAHKKTIVVTGTHGKTTTTAMLGQALIKAGIDPTVIVGSSVRAFEGRNIHVGHSQWMVVEGCEYRRSFLSFKPFGMIVLNCELEHVDYYKDEDDYVRAFEELAEKLPGDGFLVYNGKDENCQKINAVTKCKGIAISDAEGIVLKIPGDFNKLNAAHARAAALEIGADADKVQSGLAEFSGTARRMEIKGETHPEQGEEKGITVIDDYGHHPTEVRATLSALKEKYPESRLICVFQPHQYSRTHQLIGDFKTAFGDADEVIIPNIFEARDTAEDKAKISAEKLAGEIPSARFGDGFENTVAWLRQNTRPGDIVVTMGAGDVYKVGEAFL